MLVVFHLVVVDPLKERTWGHTKVHTRVSMWVIG